MIWSDLRQERSELGTRENRINLIAMYKLRTICLAVMFNWLPTRQYAFSIRHGNNANFAELRYCVSNLSELPESITHLLEIQLQQIDKLSKT